MNVTMEAKPLQIVPSSHNTAGGPQKKIDMGHTVESEGRKRVVMVKEEKEKEKNSSSFSSSSVELHIGVAATHSAPQAINHVMITEAQRCELHHQVLIFNNLLYNLPLPQSHHLLHFPTNMSEYSHLGFEYGSMVDPEPHRCRRTDGKKWRCSKSVVPYQKYCERHMHRGRNRSRKPVETSQVNSTLVTKPSSKSHTKPASKTEIEISNSSVLVVQPGDTSSSTPSRSLSVVNCASANNSRLKISSSSGDYLASVSSASLVSPGSTLATTVAPKVVTFSSVVNANSDNRSYLNVCKKDSHIKSCVSNNISVKSGGKGSIAGGDGSGISTGIGFSPTSVLQVSGCNPSYLNDRNNIEPEPGRCRRTDGKKWRCKNAVLPGQKYCSTHMHRGAKKRFMNHEPPATTTMPSCSAITVARLPQSSAATNLQKAYCTIPNTNLSMSVPATEPFIQRNEKSVSSSDTDTTITDTLNECSYASF